MTLKNFNTYFFFGVLVIVSVFAYKMFAPYISAIFVAAIIAVMLRWLYRWLCDRTGDRAALAATIACIVALFIIVLPVFGALGVVVSEAAGVIGSVTQDGSREQQLAKDALAAFSQLPVVQSIFTNPEGIFGDEKIQDAFTTVSQKLLGLVQKTSAGVVSTVVWIFVMFFTLFYFFIDGKKFIKKIMYLSPMSDKHEKMLIGKFISMTRATLKGTVVIGFIQGTLGGLTLWTAGVASPMIWTIVMIILSIIPAVGASLVMFPIGIAMLLLGHTWEGTFIIAAAIVVSSIDNVLRPKLVGNDTQMHTLLVFFATLGGLSVFGLIGFVVGPIIMALFLALWDIYGLEFKEQLKKYNA